MKLLLLAVLMFYAITLNGQMQTYEAFVLDDKGQPVSFATIHELGTDNYTTTNTDGNFILETNSSDFTIKISSIGFQSLQLEITNSNFPDKIILKTHFRLFKFYFTLFYMTLHDSNMILYGFYMIQM